MNQNRVEPLAVVELFQAGDDERVALHDPIALIFCGAKPSRRNAW